MTGECLKSWGNPFNQYVGEFVKKHGGDKKYCGGLGKSHGGGQTIRGGVLSWGVLLRGVRESRGNQ